MSGEERQSDAGSRHAISRRQFLRGSVAAAVLARGSIALGACDVAGPAPGAARPLLRRPPTVAAAGAALIAAPGSAMIAPGAHVPAWLFNGQLPGPTLRARRGEHCAIRLVNQLPESTIVHWHGLIVPEHSDGHPRYAIPPGALYDYWFPVHQRAGTFWYHPHAHHRTGAQVGRGLAGFFVIDDDEEAALNLPAGEHELLLLLQDRAGDTASAYGHVESAEDHLTGMLRDVPFGNGTRRPRVDVDGSRYRLRILNASQARTYLLALEGGPPLVVIGNDGGLLPEPATVDRIWLGVGERIDLLVDFSTVEPDSRLMLQSLPFSLASAPAGAHPQGMAMDLVEFVRTRAAGAPSAPLPAILSNIASPGAASAERSFVFRSAVHGHLVNDTSFDMDRVDVRIPLGATERWTFHNDSTLPHPVHVHGTHFRVLARHGGRGTVFPYERGWKDTVLLLPLETVEVLVRFDTWTGLFPLHCHNLQHEDMGMMLNIEVY